MSTNGYHERITRDPHLCGGEPVFKGTRITLRTVLASLAAGDTAEQILADFPTLKQEDVQAAISRSFSRRRLARSFRSSDSMKIKLDENLPVSIATRLTALGHDVHTSQSEGLGGCADPQIWAAAQREERFLITQDLDFSDIRSFAPGTHYGVL